MTPEKRNLIDDIAVTLRSAMDIDSEDFDIAGTVADIGGKIEYLDGLLSEECVVKTADNGFCIRINRKHPATRQRFAIARELGHLFMHMKYGYDEWAQVRPGEKDLWAPGSHMNLAEEANEFAAAFLMPADGFINMAKETSDGTYFYPGKIAERYNVYQDAVVYRGKMLGLW